MGLHEPNFNIGIFVSVDGVLSVDFLYQGGACPNACSNITEMPSSGQCAYPNQLDWYYDNPLIRQGVFRFLGWRKCTHFRINRTGRVIFLRAVFPALGR